VIRSHINYDKLNVGGRRGTDFEGRGVEKKIAIPFIYFG
jgi:hypothetical protein